MGLTLVFVVFVYGCGFATGWLFRLIEDECQKGAE